MRLHHVLHGLIAGSLATIPMTITMTALHHWLPSTAQQPLPPRQITEHLVAAAGGAAAVRAAPLRALTLLNHLGFGASMGVVYQVSARRLPLPAALRGVGFALAVWSLSYQGWVPLLRLAPAASDDAPPRTALMIVAHLVYGATLGLAAERLEIR